MDEPRSFTVTVPYLFALRGGRKLVITPNELEAPEAPDNRDEVLIKALARGFRWRRLLDGGQFQTIEELSKTEGVSASFISRFSRLALLNPTIVEAILNGQQPRLLDLKHLLRPFPADWSEQRRHFGFDGRSY